MREQRSFRKLESGSFLLRRRLLAAGLAGGAMLALPAGLSAALVATPRQSEGPFYPLELPLDSDNDLVTVEGRPQRAAGIVTHVFGRVLNEAGGPVSGARVEIWQCDAFGRYHHPGDRGSLSRSSVPRRSPMPMPAQTDHSSDRVRMPGLRAANPSKSAVCAALAKA